MKNAPWQAAMAAGLAVALVLTVEAAAALAAACCAAADASAGAGSLTLTLERVVASLGLWRGGVSGPLRQALTVSQRGGLPGRKRLVSPAARAAKILAFCP
jgi:hypothetical protein